MENNKERIAALEQQVQQLSSLMGAKLNELNAIRIELNQLKSLKQEVDILETTHEDVPPIIPDRKIINRKPSQFSIEYENLRRDRNKRLETLIGTNIINKIGMLVLIVGVYIGVKYAIDNQLISPVLRIILGYTMAMGLATAAILVKKKYTDFSAVMMGGAIAITYFNTFVAFTFYQLMPQMAAFGLMLGTTITAVYMAIHYNRTVIALIGQVGAYAIPFLLSRGAGNVALLMVYVCIINMGMLYLSVQRNWKSVYVLAFSASWIIFLAAISAEDSKQVSFAVGMALLTLQFLIFLSTFLVFKIIKKENYHLREIAVLLLNAILFFAGSYLLIWNLNVQPKSFNQEREYLTIFAVALGILHLALGLLVRKLKPADNTVHLFLGGLGISFLTIAVPIAFKGNTITILWATETVVMAWIFRRYQRILYHNIALVLFTLTGFSLAMDWYAQYLDGIYSTGLTPFLNAPFLSCIFTGLCLMYISYSYSRNKESDQQSSGISFSQIAGTAVFLVLLLSALFEIEWTFPFFIEKWKMMIKEPSVTMALYFYSLSYLIAWTLLNLRFFKRQDLHQLLSILSFMGMLIMLVNGLEALGEFRDFYLQQDTGHALSLLGIRYIFFLLIALLLFALKKADDQLASTSQTTNLLRLLFNITLLSVLCNEFIHWMDILGYQNQNKLGLSIISGLYALTLVILGIMKNQKSQRISGMILMGLTLVKIFFYDLANMSNISKTVVLIIMGMILLAASFMYNRYLEKMKNEEK